MSPATAAHPQTCPATTEAVHPETRCEQYPADPPTVEEIVAVMSTVGDRADGHRLRALVVLLWRAGLRISESASRQAAARAPIIHELPTCVCALGGPTPEERANPLPSVPRR
jgi:hypothetical protein